MRILVKFCRVSLFRDRIYPEQREGSRLVGIKSCVKILRLKPQDRFCRETRQNLVSFLVLLGIYSVNSYAMVHRIISLEGGYDHTCALMEEGSVWCWGSNGSGQLGLGDGQSRLSPVQIPLPQGRRATSISIGNYSSCALFDDRSLRCWGQNTNGILGLGLAKGTVGSSPNEKVSLLPSVNLGTISKIKKIATGNSHSCALFDNGKVKCWGDNYQGNLGLGDTRSRGTNSNDMGDNLPWVDLGNDILASDVCVGYGNNSCVLLTNHTVKCWGPHQGTGQGNKRNIGSLPQEMGDGLKPIDLGTNAKVKRITCGWNGSCVILFDGTVKCWGYNRNGVLGIARENDEVIGDDPYEMGDSLPRVNLGSSGIPPTEINCEIEHCCSLFENNAIKCWGRNNEGCLGVGDTNPRGLLASDMGDNLPYVDLGRLVLVKQVKMGGAHSCVALSDGSAKCWGWSIGGQLGNGQTSPNIGTDPVQMGNNLFPLSFK